MPRYRKLGHRITKEAPARIMDEGATMGRVSSWTRFHQDALESGPICLAGLYAMLLAIAVIASARYVVANRRHWMLLVAFALCLGAGGYVAYDSDYVLLNLSMRDAQKVRADCQRLLQNRQASEAAAVSEVSDAAMSSYARDVQLVGTAIPASLARIGATVVRVTPRGVYIYIYYGYEGGGWGLLFNPELANGATEQPGSIRAKPNRATLYRDFYEFRARGE